MQAATARIETTKDDVMYIVMHGIYVPPLRVECDATEFQLHEQPEYKRLRILDVAPPLMPGDDVVAAIPWGFDEMPSKVTPCAVVYLECPDFGSPVGKAQFLRIVRKDQLLGYYRGTVEDTLLAHHVEPGMLEELVDRVFPLSPLQ